MPNIPTAINAAVRAQRAWIRIQRSPVSIQIIRGGTKQSAQTVRIEISNGGGGVDSPLGNVGTQGIVVYGIRNHPTEADTDIKRLDRVVIGGKEYTFDTIVLPPGEVQAFGTVKQ